MPTGPNDTIGPIGPSPTATGPNDTTRGPPPEEVEYKKYKKSFTEAKRWHTYQEENTEEGIWKGHLVGLTYDHQSGYVEEKWQWTPPNSTRNIDAVKAPAVQVKLPALPKAKAKAKAKGKGNGKAKAKAKAKGKGNGKGKGRGANWYDKGKGKGGAN